jgi:D-alanyl-D-alanine dipeptidase
MLPSGFIYLRDPRIILSMNYVTANNFMGRQVSGYHAPVCILTEEAAGALIALQDVLDKKHRGLCLKIFDAYRPQQAVKDFKNWSLDPHDQIMKSAYYPTLPKPELFKQGYIAEESSHSRGSTVDLTLAERQSEHHHQELDMGTIFDYFHEHSHTDNPHISERARTNRLLLKNLMHDQGFENYPFEWWHFTLKNEPFAEQYFDFPVR